jgi:hypothetical protein
VCRDFGRSLPLRRLHVASDRCANGVRRRIPRRRDRAGVSPGRTDIMSVSNASTTLPVISDLACRPDWHQDLRHDVHLRHLKSPRRSGSAPAASTAGAGRRSCPALSRRLAGFQLRGVQQGPDPDDWKPMQTVGLGVREIRTHIAGAHRVFDVTTRPRQSTSFTRSRRRCGRRARTIYGSAATGFVL